MQVYMHANEKIQYIYLHTYFDIHKYKKVTKGKQLTQMLNEKVKNKTKK